MKSFYACMGKPPSPVFITLARCRKPAGHSSFGEPHETKWLPASGGYAQWYDGERIARIVQERWRPMNTKVALMAVVASSRIPDELSLRAKDGDSSARQLRFGLKDKFQAGEQVALVSLEYLQELLKRAGEPLVELPTKFLWRITVGGEYGSFYFLGSDGEAEERRKLKAQHEGATARMEKLGVARHPDPNGTVAEKPCDGSDAWFLEGLCTHCGWPFPTHTKQGKE